MEEPEAIAGPERAARWAGRTQVEPEHARETLEQAMKQVAPAAAALVNRLRGLAADDYSVEFGIKLSASAGVVIASAGTEGHFTIRLGWLAKVEWDMPEPREPIAATFLERTPQRHP